MLWMVASSGTASHVEAMVEIMPVCWYFFRSVRNQAFLDGANWISQPSTVGDDPSRIFLDLCLDVFSLFEWLGFAEFFELAKERRVSWNILAVVARSVRKSLGNHG